MYERFTDRARKVMQLATQEAIRLNHEYIGTEHILLGLVKEGSGVAANVLKNLDVNLLKIRQEVEKLVMPCPDAVTPGKLPRTPRAKKVIEYAIEEARNLNHNYVGTEHVLLGLLREQEGVAAQVLMILGMHLEDVRQEVLNLLGPAADDSLIPAAVTATRTKSRAPALDVFGWDLTELARQQVAPPLVGRTREMEQMLVVLMGQIHPWVLLVGESGSGRKALAEGLAARIVRPNALPFQRVVAVDLGIVRLGTDGWKQAGERLQACLNEARKTQTVLCVESLSLLLAGGSGISAGLLQALLRQMPPPAPPVIALVTPAEHSECITRNPEVASLFQAVYIEPLTKPQTVEVLRGLRTRLEEHHHVSIAEEALTAAVEMSGRVQPGDALRLLDRAAALLRLRTDEPPPDMSALDQQIESLNQQKEVAVAEQDFARAACLRDQADQIKKRRERTLREWEGSSRRSHLLVDEMIVGEALQILTDDGGPRPNVIA